MSPVLPQTAECFRYTRRYADTLEVSPSTVARAPGAGQIEEPGNGKALLKRGKGGFGRTRGDSPETNLGWITLAAVRIDLAAGADSAPAGRLRRTRRDRPGSQVLDCPVSKFHPTRGDKPVEGVIPGGASKVLPQARR